MKADRIIQIFRFLPVNRHHQKGTQISPSLSLLLFHHPYKAIGLIQRLLREHRRNIIAPYDRQNIHTRLIHLAQNFRDSPLRATSFSAIIQDLCHRLRPVYSIA